MIKKIVVTAGVVLAVMFFFSPEIFGATFTWTGTNSTDWFTAVNWTNNAVPTQDDSVVFPSTGVTNNPTLSSNATVASLIIQSNCTLTCTSNLTVTGAISNAGTLYLKGVTLDNTGGSFSNTGTLRLQGGETFTGFTMDTGHGTVEYMGAGGSGTILIHDFGTGTNSDYYNLRINGATTETFRVQDTKTLTVAGNLTLTQGIFDNATYDENITVAGNVTMDNTRTDMGDGTWTVGGSWDNVDVGTLNANSSTLEMTGTGNLLIKSYGTTFYNLTVSGTATRSGTGTFYIKRLLQNPCGGKELPPSRRKSNGFIRFWEGRNSLRPSV